MDWMPQAIREGIFTVLFISGPLVILAAVLGLTVGVVQAATQVQEQTLGSAVKILGLFLALILFGFYIFQYLRKYTEENIMRAFKLVPSLGSYSLPRKNIFGINFGKDEDQQKPITFFESPPEKSEGAASQGSSRLATESAFDQPDIENVNVGKKEEKLPPQPAQRPRPTEPEIQAQPLQTPSATPKTAPVNPSPQKPTQQPTNRPPAQQPQQAAPAKQQPTPQPPAAAPPPQPPATPQPPPSPLADTRSRASSALKRIQESIKDVKKSQSEP